MNSTAPHLKDYSYTIPMDDLPSGAQFLELGRYDTAPLNIAYRPLGGARRVWQSKVHELMIHGPAETGKTRGCLEKLNAFCWKYPGVQCVIGRKTFSSLKSTVLQTFERHVLQAWDPEYQVFDNKLTPVEKYGGEQPQFYSYPNKSRIWLGGLDKASRILSAERDMIYINQCEELTLDDWQTLMTRATGRAGGAPYAQMLGDCNPGPATHWILARAKAGSMKLIKSVHRDNPTLYDPDTAELTKQGHITMGILDSLVGILHKRLRLGIWASAEGIVYEDYDQDIHLIDSFPIPEDWKRFIVIDFGYTNPFVCQWWAEAPGGDFYMYREIYHSQILAEFHAEAIRYLSGFSTQLSHDNPYVHMIRHSLRSQAPEQIVGGIADHDAEDAATLERYGVYTVRAFKSISIGIEEVRRRLKIRGDGNTGIHFFRDALAHEPDDLLIEKHQPMQTIDELPIYSYPKIMEGRTVKENPIDLHNHGMDCKRYLFATLFCAPVEVSQAVYDKVVLATY